jgi:hypothetical protein
MHALAPRIDVFLHVPTQAFGASNRRISTSALVNTTLSASRRHLRNLRASLRSGNTQEADRAEEARKLGCGAESCEWLTAPIRLGLHGLHNLHMWRTRGQSRGVRGEIERLLKVTATDASVCNYGQFEIFL